MPHTSDLSAKGPRVCILTLGCKVNQYESEAMAEAFSASGFSVCERPDECDIYIINTCTVTAESDRKARQLIRRLLGRAPEALMLVTGCSAQANAERIAAIPGVDAVIGNREKMHVVTLARELYASGAKPAAPILEVPSLEGAGFEPMCITRFGRTRAYVKIEDGCESRCAYCAIPAARGPIRSKAMADVLAEVQALTAGGCREIVLTGIETGAWGRELSGVSLQDLLTEIDGIPGIGRVRLGSLDPTVMSEAFVARVAGLRSLAPHFHLSMQSGCSATLARMKRRYNARQAAAAMERVRTAIPEVQFTTDIIVGFPGETEAEFAESLRFAEEAEFLHIHVFPYSKRAGTPAATMPDQVPEEIKRARVAAMAAVSERSCEAILNRILAKGKPLRFLPETHGEGFAMGHTPEFLELKVMTGDPLPEGEILVRPVGREGELLLAEPI